ncbi:AraC family transcriptional regulator [Celerinatantimonas yamalensis]|uniref:AraC family transcriptional regulator n=1 Tax=Celerinatantimonas yamalensis TaxID=559956 RepID=A0ABW9G8M9_9GAMM
MLDDILPYAVERIIDTQRPMSEDSHQHPQGQLIWMRRGMLSGQTAHQHWLIQTNMLIWIPPMISHKAQNHQSATLGVLYLPTEMTSTWPAQVRLVDASLLAIGIFDKLLQKKPASAHTQHLLIDLLCDELKQAPPSDNQLPLPSDPRLKKITDALILSPALRQNLTQWGKQVGASSRTLARLFVKETGLSYRVWQHRLRRVETLSGLRDGLTQEQLTEHLGFSSVDAFSHWVKRIFQTTIRTLKQQLIDGRVTDTFHDRDDEI